MKSNWRQRSLRELCGDGLYGLTASGNSAAVGPKFLRTTDMINGEIDWNSVPYCEVDDLKASKYQVQDGDLVISRTGANAGAAAYVVDAPNNAVFAGYLVRFRADHDVADARFIGYVLRSALWNRYVDGARTGSAQPQLNAVLMGDFSFPCPPLPEQRQIAEVLCSIDNLIQANHVIRRNCDLLAQSLAYSTNSLIPLRSLASDSVTASEAPRGLTDHYSLPAFDEHHLPQRVDGALIKSNKLIVTKPSVLIARLNPHIPRVWMIYPSPGVLSATSTEFVPIEGSCVSTEAIWASCSDSRFISQMNSLVTGTTGSHQRVDKRAILDLLIPNLLELTDEKRVAIQELVRESCTAQSTIRNLEMKRDQLVELFLSGVITVKNAAA